MSQHKTNTEWIHVAQVLFSLTPGQRSTTLVSSFSRCNAISWDFGSFLAVSLELVQPELELVAQLRFSKSCPQIPHPYLDRTDQDQSRPCFPTLALDSVVFLFMFCFDRMPTRRRFDAVNDPDGGCWLPVSDYHLFRGSSVVEVQHQLGILQTDSKALAKLTQIFVISGGAIIEETRCKRPADLH